MDKKPWQSKSIILNVIISLVGIVAMLGFAPSLKEWVDGHNEILLTAIGLVGVGLRMITKGAIVIE